MVKLFVTVLSWVKTVSKYKVSSENFSEASLSLIKLSLSQERKLKITETIIIK